MEWNGIKVSTHAVFHERDCFLLRSIGNKGALIIQDLGGIEPEKLLCCAI